MKKAKRMHESQNQSNTKQQQECKLSSIQNDLVSDYGLARYDDVYYVDGRMVIPLGRDSVPEELLSTTTVQES
jgi:hypothetical protein